MLQCIINKIFVVLTTKKSFPQSNIVQLCFASNTWGLLLWQDHKKQWILTILLFDYFIFFHLDSLEDVRKVCAACLPASRRKHGSHGCHTTSIIQYGWQPSQKGSAPNRPWATGGARGTAIFSDWAFEICMLHAPTACALFFLLCACDGVRDEMKRHKPWVRFSAALLRHRYTSA